MEIGKYLKTATKISLLSLIRVSYRNSHIGLSASQQIAQRGRISHPRKLKFSAVANFKEYLKTATKISLLPFSLCSIKPQKLALLSLMRASVLAACLMLLPSCAGKSVSRADEDETQRELEALLLQPGISSESRFAITNKIATKMLSDGNFYDLILYLTDYVESNEDDEHDSYWLLMCAYAYIQMNQEKVAEYYFERIIRNYPDLMVKGQSIHYMCLERLIQISTNHENRINYFNTLISQFPSEVSITEMYVRLAREYEQTGEWARALKTYNMFLEQPDASSIQIADLHDIYNYARHLITFNNSPKNWTFATLDELASATKDAISHYQPRRLDTYRSKVNFFAVSWRQDENVPTGQVEFSMQNFMKGNRIRFSENLIPGPTINEAYLRTTGWTTGVPTWYFYFRKVNFPADPKIHGRWEWAGIYIGEMS